MKQRPFENFSFSQFPRNTKPIPGSSSLLNPGSLSDLHRKCRDIAPIWLEGAHFSYKHQYSPSTILMLRWVMSHATPTGVRIGALYSPMVEDNILKTPLIHVDINPGTMTVNCAVQYQPLPMMRMEFQQQLEPLQGIIADNVLRCDLIGSSCTATLHAFNIQKPSGRFILSYLQNITARLAVGAEFSTFTDCVPKLANTALALRYSLQKNVVAATISPQAFDVTYWRQLDDNIQLGASVVYNEWTRTAIGSIFYQWLFSDATVRGMVDSDWSVGFTYNRRLRDLCCNLGFSILLCVPANKFACGFKFDFETNNKSCSSC